MLPHVWFLSLSCCSSPCWKTSNYSFSFSYFSVWSQAIKMRPQRLLHLQSMEGYINFPYTWMTHLFLFTQCNLDAQLTAEILRLHLSWRVQHIPSGPGTLSGCTQVSAEKNKQSERPAGLESQQSLKKGDCDLAPRYDLSPWPTGLPLSSGKNRDIRGVLEACITLSLKGRIFTAPDFGEQILWTPKIPSL